ncbi:MAG: hypothetical protein QY321_02005 [Patescibacteria group bacterium]|nr:MAG: hypothetical protein QY321_02005 [Patescibacteria group bacterium]
MSTNQRLTKKGTVYYKNLGSLNKYEAVEEMKIISANNEGKVVETDFNGVVISVKSDSNTDLIIRDLNRAFLGFIPRIVGPYPNTELSCKHIFLVKDIDMQKIMEEEEKILSKMKERGKLWRDLFECPPMEFKNESNTRRNWKNAISAVPKMKETYFFVEAWARFMQKTLQEKAMVNGDHLYFEDVERDFHKTAKLFGIKKGKVEVILRTLIDHWRYASLLQTK